MDLEVTPVAPGEVDVTLDDGHVCRVLIPAGVGVAGFPDTALASALIDWMMATGIRIPRQIDASQILASHPGSFRQVERALEADAEDG